MSITVLPLTSPAPRSASAAAVYGVARMSRSAPAAIWPGGTARTLPPALEAACSACERSCAVMLTWWPAAARRFAKAEPMLPAPMIPIFMSCLFLV